MRGTSNREKGRREREGGGGRETFKYMNDGDVTGVGQVPSQPPLSIPPYGGDDIHYNLPGSKPNIAKSAAHFPVGQGKLFFLSNC